MRNCKQCLLSMLVLIATIAISVAGFAQEVRADKYPEKNITVWLPTSEGGSIDRLFRAVTKLWSEYLGTNFEGRFDSGAGGEVAYTFFNNAPADGYTLLMGNIGPEMIMYVLQEPDFNFPGDFTYFATLDADPAELWVRKDSPFETIQDLVEEAKKQSINLSQSRYPHPATIAALILAEETGAKFNIIPYGGGSPARTAGLSGEVDGNLAHLFPMQDYADDIRFLIVFNEVNNWKKFSNNAPTPKEAFGIDMPGFGANRAFAVRNEFIEKYPERYKLLADTLKKVFEDPRLEVELKKVGLDMTTIQFLDAEKSMKIAMGNLEMARKYKHLLQGNRQ